MSVNIPPNPYVPNTFNPNNFISSSSGLTIQTGDARYLQLTGGTITGQLKTTVGTASTSSSTGAIVSAGGFYQFYVDFMF